MRFKIFKYRICILVMMLVGILASGAVPVYAAGLSINVSKATIKLGEQVTVTVSVPSGYGATVSVNYDSAILQLVSSSGNGALMNLGDAMGQPLSGTITFSAIAEGDCSITAIATIAGDAEGNQVDLASAGGRVTVNAASAQANTGTGASNSAASTDNTLADLKISDGKLSPEFQSSITKYAVTVDYSVESLAVTATPKHKKAKVSSISGNSKLEVGDNTVKVTVKAENGATQSYIITVTRLEKGALNEESLLPPTDGFVIDETVYQPCNQIPQELIPADFEPGTIYLFGQEYPSLEFVYGNIKLICLTNGSDGGHLYVFDEQQMTVSPFEKTIGQQTDLEALQGQMDDMIALNEEFKNNVQELLEINAKLKIVLYIAISVICILVILLIILYVFRSREDKRKKKQNDINIIEL